MSCNGKKHNLRQSQFTHRATFALLLLRFLQARVSVATKRKIVVFGLTVSSSWANGHATLWRALLRSLGKLGHQSIFFERDVPYYASARDLHSGDGYEIVLYRDWNEVLPRAERALRDADAAIVTSYCADAVAATQFILAHAPLIRVFYDLDTPVTLDRLSRNEPIDYLPPNGLGDFDLVLSFTGGKALDELRTRLGARNARPLYGSVDVRAHAPVDANPAYASDLSYLGTFAADRQESLERLFVDTAERLHDRMFVIGGSMYPQDFPRRFNIRFIDHVPPGEHPAFYCSSRLTLNVTRGAMAKLGYCPSGRLFEAAACGTPILSDAWEGLDQFFDPGREIFVARSTDEVVDTMRLPAAELAAVANAARKRVMSAHTSERRAEELIAALDGG